MKKIFSLALSFVFLFNGYLPAFAEYYDYKGMLKNGSNPSWLEHECVTEFSCKYLPSKNNESRNFMRIGIEKYKRYWQSKWNNITEEEQNKFLTAVHCFAAGFGFNAYIDEISPLGELKRRPITNEEKMNSVLERERICSENSTRNTNGQKRTETRKAFIPDLQYIPAEDIYPSSGNSEPCKDMKQFEPLLKGKIREIYAKGKHCIQTGDCDFDIHKVVRNMVTKSDSKECNDKFYLTTQNLRYLFIVYAALINNTPEDVNKLLNYINGDYSERVQAAAANAAMAFSKYSLNVSSGQKTANTPPGTLDYTEGQRDIIAAGVSLEYMRAGLSEAGYNLYKQNTDRIIEGYDKSDLVIIDQNGNTLQKSSMPAFATIMLLAAAGEMLEGGSIALGGSGDAIVMELSKYGSAIIRHLKTPIDLSRIATLAKGAVVIESSALGVVLAALAIPAAMIYELNNAFAGSYLRAKKDSLNKYVNNLITSATALTYEYDYSPSVPENVMYMVRGVNKITISRSKANALEISLDRNNQNRITCKEINTKPVIINRCIDNLDMCIKSAYRDTASAKLALEASGYSEPSFNKALQYEDKIASTKYPSKPIVWRVVHEPLIGGWTPYGELPVYPWEVNTKDLIKVTTQLAEDEVFTILYDVFRGRAELTVNGTAIRIGADEMQGGRSRNGQPNSHFHFEEIQYFKDGQPYICNHAIYFDVPKSGRNMTARDYADALLNMFY